MNVESARRRLAGGLLAVAMLALAGCEIAAPVRTLPAWVRGVHVPMIRNESYEPGVEEYATRATQEAFLRDGRLDVAPRNQADLIVVAKVLRWNELAAGTSGDRVTDDREVRLTAEVDLYEPFNPDAPLARLGEITVRGKYNIDVRSTDFMPYPQRRDDLMEKLGEQIVQLVITGFPIELGQRREIQTLPDVARIEDVR